MWPVLRMPQPIRRSVCARTEPSSPILGVVVPVAPLARAGDLNDTGVISAYHGRMVAASDPQHDPGQPFGQLSARDAELLAFERQWWKFAGAKEQAIRDKFAMSATRYYQVLNALIDKPEALVQDPLLVKRLRRLRATRQRLRSAKRLGIDLTVE